MPPSSACAEPATSLYGPAPTWRRSSIALLPTPRPTSVKRARSAPAPLWTVTGPPLASDSWEGCGPVNSRPELPGTSPKATDAGLRYCNPTNRPVFAASWRNSDAAPETAMFGASTLIATVAAPAWRIAAAVAVSTPAVVSDPAVTAPLAFSAATLLAPETVRLASVAAPL